MFRRYGDLAPTLAAIIAIFGGMAHAETGSLIFIHPDGTSASTWAVARVLYHGPDGELHWDKLPAIAVYRGHMADSLTASSNGAGTTHAYGVKVATSAYGMTAAEPEGKKIVDEDGQSLSVAKQAIRRGIPVGLVQTGTLTEPGTGCFLASVGMRKAHQDIALQLVESGAALMLGGGERFFLPEGTKGVHGVGVRTDGRNLLKEARERGYSVVRTKAELLGLSSGAKKVLGVFADLHTFHDMPEEKLRAKGLPMYEPDAPTVAEMTEAALRILGNHRKQFLLVVEEEGTDNFGNNNNASGMLEAMRRADDAIGIARAYIKTHRDTLLLTASDSDGGGMRMLGVVSDTTSLSENLPERTNNGAPMDGRDGTGTPPFIAAPDRQGRRLGFAVVWTSFSDVSGGILVRAEGHNSQQVRGSIDNTQIAEIIRRNLFRDSELNDSRTN